MDVNESEQDRQGSVSVPELDISVSHAVDLLRANEGTQLKQMLVDNPRLLTDKDDTGRILLHWAASVGNVELAQLLLRQRPETVHATDNIGMTPLMCASSAGHDRMVSWLLQQIAQCDCDNAASKKFILRTNRYGGDSTSTVINVVQSGIEDEVIIVQKGEHKRRIKTDVVNSDDDDFIQNSSLPSTSAVSPNSSSSSSAIPDKVFACGSCTATFPTPQARSKHLKLFDHKLRLAPRPDELTKECGSVDELEQFLTEFQQQKLVFWIKKRAMAKRKGYSVQYYQCHRSGQYISSAKKRYNKVNRTVKCGERCPAYLKAIHWPSGAVTVHYTDNHCDHGFHVMDQKIDQATEKRIAEMAIDNIPINEILEDIRGDHIEFDPKTNFKPARRSDCLMKYEIRNIIAKFQIHKFYSDKSDYASINQFYYDDQNSESPNIFYYKGNDREFRAIGIQTATQMHFMKTFGKQIVCVDTTFGSTVYDLKVCTLMTIDPNGKGISIGHIIVPGESREHLLPAFLALKAHLGPDFQTSSLMSDCAPVFKNVWEEVFGEVNWYFCDWHVKRAWKKKTREAGKENEDIAQFAFRMMGNLSRERDRAAFDKMATNILKLLREKVNNVKLNALADYYEDHYLRPEMQDKWAGFARYGQSAHTNMFVERFYGRLKYEVLKGKKSPRLDIFIEQLLHLIKTEGKELAITLMRGTASSYRQKKMNAAHLRTEYLRLLPGLTDIDRVSQVNKNQWMVPSEQKLRYQPLYSVTLEHEICPFESYCNVKCHSCGICPHMFACDCFVGVRFANQTSCKHAHFVASEHWIKSDEARSAQKQFLETRKCASTPTADNPLKKIVSAPVKVARARKLIQDTMEQTKLGYEALLAHTATACEAGDAQGLAAASMLTQVNACLNKCNKFMNAQISANSRKRADIKDGLMISKTKKIKLSKQKRY